ncbi:MAG TPA: lipoprotein insertase outer membrane protein LolB [Burkholderiaceae bacterium]|nr:lipoprotein insertase outer membrane protein LolB [Burkholderiaceae bacterium]
MNRSRRLAYGFIAIAIFLMGGCAYPTKSTGQNDTKNAWQGRLALRVDSDPPQSFAAAFELTGAAAAGELVLSTPIGTTLAILTWSPQSARLRSNGEVRSFDSLDALALQATGATTIPIASLFDWLAGVATPTDGWQADVTQLANGRITARRTAPLPTAELKLVLDQ